MLSLRAIHASEHEVLAVVTRPPAPKGRGRRLEPSAVEAVARELELPVFAPPSLQDSEFVARLSALAPECCPVVAYGSLVPAGLLGMPAFGWINLHFSLLPAWRGAAPVQHAILHGDDVTGATTFRLDEGMDTGPVFGQVTEAVGPEDTAADLLSRLARSGAVLLVHTLDAISDGSASPLPQPTEGVSFAPKLSVDDARVDWGRSALHINRLVRACYPSPGAWTMHGDARLKLLASAVIDGIDLSPGQVRVDKREVVVGCGISALRVERVQPQGKRAMPAVDWARGLRSTDDLWVR